MEVPIFVYPKTFDTEQRVKASQLATEMGVGLILEITNYTARYFGSAVVPVGKVAVRTAVLNDGPMRDICLLETPDANFDLPKAIRDFQTEPCMYPDCQLDATREVYHPTYHRMYSVCERHSKLKYRLE